MKTRVKHRANVERRNFVYVSLRRRALIIFEDEASEISFRLWGIFLYPIYMQMLRGDEGRGPSPIGKTHCNINS